VALPEAESTFNKLQVSSAFFPCVIFRGTAEYIYLDMKALNPTSVGRTTAEEDVSLTKRDTFYNWAWALMQRQTAKPTSALEASHTCETYARTVVSCGPDTAIMLK
jgi:hypothetical protein